MNQVLQKFRDEISFCKSILVLAHEQDSAGINKHDPPTISFLLNSAFLKFWIAWESFLEEAFHSYMLGLPSITGVTVGRHVSPIALEHAQKMVIGVNSYFDWARSDKVVALGIITFGDPNPFKTTLNSVNVDLGHMKTIRNAAAHISTTTQGQLDNVAYAITGILAPRTSPSDLLMKTRRGSSPPITIFQYYMIVLDAAAESIAKA